ncbi:hypothetical protein JCM19233_6069 [Vibrio astriarenae]|nr:hypothetical protein JCM19233_6069 [Vibrio sp. C7]
MINQAKPMAINEIKAIVTKYKISDKELMEGLEINIAGQKKSTPSKTDKVKPPRFHYVDDNGKTHEHRGTSPKAFMKQPWRALVENGTINDHKVTHYITNNNNKAVEVWTKAKGNPPENATKFEGNNGANIDTVLEYLNQAK